MGKRASGARNATASKKVKTDAAAAPVAQETPMAPVAEKPESAPAADFADAASDDSAGWVRARCVRRVRRGALAVWRGVAARGARRDEATLFCCFAVRG
jgi:hypothetical protein